MRHSIALFAALSLLLVLLVACQPGSPEERVLAERARYTVELNSWYAEVENAPVEETVEVPVGEEGAEGQAPADDAEAAGDEAENAAEEIAEEDTEDADVVVAAGPQLHTIVFDLLVLYNGRDPLPGLTVEVTHAGADGEEKGSWLEYLEMPDITKGVSKQVGFQRAGVLFEEGDVFAVLVEPNVPADVRSEYREFQAAGD